MKDVLKFLIELVVSFVVTVCLIFMCCYLVGLILFGVKILLALLIFLLLLAFTFVAVKSIFGW